MAKLSLLITTVLSLCLVAPSASAQWGVSSNDERDWRLSLSGGWLQQSVEGDVLFGTGVANTPLDVEAALDLEDSEEFAGHIDLQAPGNLHFRLGYSPLSFGGDTVLTAAQVVNGVTYNIGDRVSSNLQLDNYEAALGYKFRLGEHLMLAPVLQVNLLDGLLDTVDLDVAASFVEEKFLTPIPLVGLRAELYPIERLTFFAEAKGFAASNWGELQEATATDGEAGLSLRLSENLAITARYQLTQFKFDVSDSDADIDLSGLGVSLDLRF